MYPLPGLPGCLPDGWSHRDLGVGMITPVAEITVDGQSSTARLGETVLAVCRRLGKDIPTLCHHEAVEPYAACRVCLVEVESGGRCQLAPSCQYPVSEGLIVRTETPAVRSARRIVLELLLARCPASAVVRELADRYGVSHTPYSTDDPDQTCILCGLCVRVCEELVGVVALGFTQRGIERAVTTPFGEASDVCIGCGACVAVCPTGHVRSIDDGPMRQIATWKTNLELLPCEVCGRPFAPGQTARPHPRKLPAQIPLYAVCAVCRRSRTVSTLAEIAARRQETTKPDFAGRQTSKHRSGGSCHDR